jgi:hypothetical protein
VPRPGSLIANCAEKIQPGGGLVISTPNGQSPHNWRFQRYDPMVMESSEREKMASGLGARETHLFNFRMRTLLELLRSRSFIIRRSAYLNSYVINPIGLHRALSATAAATLNRFCARLPGIARYSTMTLFVLAGKS